MSELNQLIGFLEEQLTVSEPTPDYTRHNQEIITYIEYLKSIKQPQLNESQQIVLDWFFLNKKKTVQFEGVDGKEHSLFYTSDKEKAKKILAILKEEAK